MELRFPADNPERARAVDSCCAGRRRLLRRSNCRDLRRRRRDVRSRFFFFSSRRRHTRSLCDWSSDVCSSDLFGEWGDKPNYFDVTVWGNQGESCAQYLSKGRPVGVDGRLDWREWDAQDGTKRQAVEIIAESVQFLGGRDPEGGAGQPPF